MPVPLVLRSPSSQSVWVPSAASAQPRPSLFWDSQLARTANRAQHVAGRFDRHPAADGPPCTRRLTRRQRQGSMHRNRLLPPRTPHESQSCDEPVFLPSPFLGEGHGARVLLRWSRYERRGHCVPISSRRARLRSTSVPPAAAFSLFRPSHPAACGGAGRRARVAVAADLPCSSRTDKMSDAGPGRHSKAISQPGQNGTAPADNLAVGRLRKMKTIMRAKGSACQQDLVAL
jgi:hypothetical protein